MEVFIYVIVIIFLLFIGGILAVLDDIYSDLKAIFKELKKTNKNLRKY